MHDRVRSLQAGLDLEMPGDTAICRRWILDGIADGIGRILFKAVLSVAEKQAKEAEKLPDGPEKENKRKGALFLKRILESNSLRSMSMTAGTSLPYNYAEGFIALTNRRLIRGVLCFLKKIKVPELPKNQK